MHMHTHNDNNNSGEVNDKNHWSLLSGLCVRGSKRQEPLVPSVWSLCQGSKRQEPLVPSVWSLCQGK